ncbi:hypothetical protein E3N88_14737 [Mikania micrantha]|uniref:Uncharacterized protein n=1 Tax=Mikania micrantha TaxID=192012 RepID=A0A5N6P3K9_9ASTR|nr:hypothetical protein E3N88_14737 [Mikania micrantha]
MVNVGENRARNGVMDCPKSWNEEKSQSIEFLDSSRYATKRLRILRGTRWSKISEIFRISSRYAKPYLAPRRGRRRVRRWRKLTTSSDLHAEDTRLMSRRKCKTLDRGRGGIVVLPAAVGQNLSTAVKGAAFAYDV